MDYVKIISQVFGIFGLILSALSYQERNNKKFFIEQALAGLMFFINFALIGAVSAALFNMTNLVRGAIFSKKEKKAWNLIAVAGLYTICFIFSLSFIIDKPFHIFLSSLTYLTLEMMTVLMWIGNGKYIRYGQFFVSSPSWIIHNIFNFSLGGIMCEVFMMASVVVSFIRFRKEGFEE